MISHRSIDKTSIPHLSRNTLHLAEDSGEERALSTTDGPDNGSQATLLDRHVDIVDKCLGFLSVLIIRSIRSILLLGPLERSTRDADGIGIDRVSIRGNWNSLGSHQKGVDTAPGSSSDGTCTKEQTEEAASKEK